MPRSFSSAGSSDASTASNRTSRSPQFSRKTVCEHLVLRGEVVVQQPVRDARLLGDVADARGVEPVAREHANGGVEDPPALLLAQRPDGRPAALACD